MKLTAILLLSASMVASAKGHTQGISIREKNISLEKLFKEIRRQTGYVFFYDASVLSDSKPVTIDVKNGSIEDVLKASLKGQNLDFSIENKTITIIKKAKADLSPAGGGGSDRREETGVVSPPIDIHGRILNEKNEPVAASIVVKGTNKGTTTNENGEFELKGVDDNATLVISGVSIQSFEVKVNGRTELALGAKIKTNLGEEVTVEVNTGYQRIPKERATGSFDFIDNKTLNQQVGTNILQRLDGVASGVLFEKNKSNNRPQSNLNISIRGLSTINGPLDPLVVLDGFIYEGDINNINPNDVDNITILKDAAATSIWGARAGNGVIVITTKRGKFNQKPTVTFNANTIVSEKPDLYYLPQMSSSDYIDVEQFLFNKGYFNSRINAKWIALTPAVQIFNNTKKGLITSSDSLSQINLLKQIDARDQYLKYFYTNAITQQYSANLSGGSFNNAYTLSVGYDRNRGEQFSKLDKLNLNLENIFKPSKNLEVNLGVYFTKSENKSGRNIGYNGVTINGRTVPYLRFADDNGNAVSVPQTYNVSYVSTLAGGKLLDWNYYPLDNFKYTTTKINQQELYANAGLKYIFSKQLNFELKYQYEDQQANTVQLSDIDSYQTREAINLFTQYTPSTGAVKYNIPLGGIRTLKNIAVESNTLRGQFNFSHSWREHDISVIAGSEIRQTKTTADNSIQYGYTADPMTNVNVDFVSFYKTIVTGDFRQISGIFPSSEQDYRFVSLYTNGSYSFHRRYIFSASARRDGSNIFGASTNDKWKPLWSTGLGWVVSDESFYKSSLIPQLKLRITYGANGNVDLTRTALAVGRTFSNAPDTRYNFTRIQQINNPDLRWEKTKMLNFAMEFSSAKNIVTGSVEYYLKKGTDLYGLAPIDYTTTGRSFAIKNVASMKGQGVDIVLNSRNIDKVFKWNTSLLLNYNTNRTTDYYIDNPDPLSSKLGGGTAISPVIGKPLYALAAYKWGGLDALGNPQGYVDGHKSIDYDSLTTAGEVVYVGPTSPKIFGSFINTFSFKNISIAFNISYKGGYYFQKSSIAYGTLVSSGMGHADYSKRWQKPGDENITNVPSFIYPVNSYRDNFYLNSEVNVLKADNIRFQYINIAYTFTKSKKIKLPFAELQIYINGSNLGILWRANKDHLDPDYPVSVPPEKTVAFGIKGNF